MIGKPPRLTMIACAAFALAAGATPASAQALDGIWRNTRDTVRLHIAACGTALCGTVVEASAVAQADALQGSGKPLIGMQLFRDFRRADTNMWKGKIFIPDLNHNASGKIIKTDNDSLTVSGCVFAVFCKTQHWHRVSG